MNNKLKIPVKGVYRQILEMQSREESRKILIFNVFACKTEPPFAGKFRSICIKNLKYDFWLLSEPEPFSASYLYFVIHLKLQNVNLPQIIEHQTPGFFHTFTENFALVPVILHPLQ